VFAWLDMMSLTSATGTGPAKIGRMNDANTRTVVPRMMAYVTVGFMDDADKRRQRKD